MLWSILWSWVPAADDQPAFVSQGEPVHPVHIVRGSGGLFAGGGGSFGTRDEPQRLPVPSPNVVRFQQIIASDIAKCAASLRVARAGRSSEAALRHHQIEERRLSCTRLRPLA